MSPSQQFFYFECIHKQFHFGDVRPRCQESDFSLTQQLPHLTSLNKNNYISWILRMTQEVFTYIFEEQGKCHCKKVILFTSFMGQVMGLLSKSFSIHYPLKCHSMHFYGENFIYSLILPLTNYYQFLVKSFKIASLDFFTVKLF